MKSNEPRNGNGFSPIHMDTVSDRVYHYLKSAIIRGDLPTGKRIVQKDLTEQLGVSRTPVRDALQRLSAEGLVYIKPFHGAEVFELSESELHELYDIRIMMENYACQHSATVMPEEAIRELEGLNELILDHKHDVQECMNHDREFHLIMCCTNNLALIRPFLDSVWDKSNPYKALYYTKPMHVDETYVQHSRIIESIKRKDTQALAASIDHHLRDVVAGVSRSPLFSRKK